MPGALDIFGGRASVPSAMSAEQWGEMPVGVRERAFWSAKVTHAQHVADLKAACLDALNGARVKVRDLHMHRWTPEELEEVGPDGVARGDRTILMTREAVVGEMRKRALERGLTPTGPRPMEDIASAPRLRLIARMAEDTSRERARFERGNDTEVLFMWPAQELVREEQREKPRDWGTRWQAAADSVGWEGVAKNGEWIARKDSPIWVALSAFGQPYPPFDYNSGMGVEDVDRDQAVELGLVEEDEEIANPGDIFQEQLGASVQGMGDTEREWLKRTIEENEGGEVTFTPDGRVEWTPPRPTPPPAPMDPPGADAVQQVRLKQTQARLVEQLRTRQAKMEEEAREKAVAELEARRKEAEKQRLVEALKAEAEKRRLAEEAARKAAKEAHKLRREEQRTAATDGRRERLRQQMEAEGVASDIQARIAGAYTSDVAQRFKPPEIHVDRRIPKSYLTQDGRKLFVGADVRSAADLDGLLQDFGGKLDAGKAFDKARRAQWEAERQMLGAKAIRGTHTWEEDARAVNPNYAHTSNHAWDWNCQRCVTAYVARRRGMDVEAMPYLGRSDTWPFRYKAMSVYDQPTSVFPNARRNAQIVPKIESAMLNMQDGAQCIVFVQWKRSNGHYFIAEQHGGETVFIDPQTGKSGNEIAYYFQVMKPTSVELIRVDNSPLNHRLSEVCKPATNSHV